MKTLCVLVSVTLLGPSGGSHLAIENRVLAFCNLGRKVKSGFVKHGVSLWLPDLVMTCLVSGLKQHAPCCMLSRQQLGIVL